MTELGMLPRWCLPAVMIALLVACGGSDSGTMTPVAVNQTLSMAIDTPNSSAPFSTQSLDDAVSLAQSAGVQATLVTYTWSSLEPTAGQIDVSQLAAALKYYQQKNLKILLGIQVINTVKREVPADLDNVAFDDPQFISRFHALLDAVRTALSGAEQYISIGNEVDVYLAATSEWSTYATFYGDAVKYIHSTFPALQVGVTTTYGGYSGQSTALVNTLNSDSDVIILTYYPLLADAQVGPPTSPATDLPNMSALAGGKPVILQEAGYPSGSLNGSSNADQQQFVSSLLDAWHQQGNAMPFLSYFLLYDFDSTTCAALDTYYGSTDPAFTSYLCTLGLHTSDGSDKPAWNTFVSSAQ